MMNNHILAGAGWAKTFTPDASNGLSNYQPSNGWTCPRTSALTVSGKLGEVLNAPTSFTWTLTPQVQYPHTSDYQFSRPEWRDVDPAILGYEDIEGTSVSGGAIVIASDADGTPKHFAFSLDVSKIAGIRFHSEIVYTGTAPGLRSSLVLGEVI